MIVFRFSTIRCGRNTYGLQEWPALRKLECVCVNRCPRPMIASLCAWQRRRRSALSSGLGSPALSSLGRLSTPSSGVETARCRRRASADAQAPPESLRLSPHLCHKNITFNQHPWPCQARTGVRGGQVVGPLSSAVAHQHPNAAAKSKDRAMSFRGL